VLAHNIVDVRHVPGVTNIADGLSRQHEGQPHTDMDGSNWTVSPDWEQREGLILGIYQVVVKDTEDLLTRFEKEPLFRTIVEALEVINGEATIREKKRAHRLRLGLQFSQALIRPSRACTSLILSTAEMNS